MLLRTLAAYERQTAKAEILEIIIIDDGSTDGTPAAVAAFIPSSALAIRCLSNPKKGPASARNYGIRQSMGSLILFGDDDIIPEATLVAEHLAWNRRYSGDGISVMGLVKWSPELHPTPFMEWMGLYKLFGYAYLAPGGNVSFSCFYSCNLSLKRNFLMQHGMFDERFPAAALEDIELGFRLMRKGLRVVYNPSAVGYHHKQLSYSDACRRQEMIYAARVHFDSTEAGRFLKHQAPHARLDALKHGLKMAGARALAPFLGPLTPVLDSHIQLPRIAYNLFYSCVVATAEASYKRNYRESQSTTPG